MKIVKRILIGLLIFFVVLLTAAIVLPMIFKDELVALTKEEINKNVRAQVDFADLDLSLLRSFPDLNLQLQDFSVVGIDEFEGITLASGEGLSFDMNLMSVIRSKEPVRINSVTLDAPVVNVLVLADGRANYDIAVPTDERIKETAQENDYSGMVIELKEYHINNGRLTYDDRSADTYVLAENVNHHGSGNFTLDVFDLDTKTVIEGLTVNQGGIPYLKRAHTELDAVFNIQSAESLYTLKENQLRINQLVLNGDGTIQMLEEGIGMDLTLSSAQNQFKDLFSLMPNAYIAGYEDVEVGGTFALQGEIDGIYNSEKEQYPAFRIKLDIDDGRVKYPDLPTAINDIFAAIDVNSPSTDLDDLVVDIPRFSLQLGDEPFRGSFRLRTPISDPDVQASAQGAIDLGELSRAYPLEDVNVLTGTVRADMSINTRYSYIENEQYERIDMRGNVAMTDFRYETEGLPPTAIRSVRATLRPQNVLIEDLDAQLGQSDVRGSGTIRNILAYFSPGKTMTGDLKLQSNTFDTNEWITEAEGDEAVTAAANKAEESYEVFDRFDFNIDASVNKLLYDIYQLDNITAKGRMMPNRLEASSFSGMIGDSDFSGSGTIVNMFDYLFDGGILGGNINMKSRLFNLNQFMTDDATAAAGAGAAVEYEPIIIPKDVKMTIIADIDRVKYTDIVLTDMIGKLHFADGAVVLEDAVGKGLGGDVGLSGSYSTEDPAQPLFTFKYNLERLDFQETFNTFNSFAALAPIGKFLKGEFSSSLVMEGELAPDLTPKLTSIDAEGFLETINSFLEDFRPLDAVGKALNIESLTNRIELDDIKTWFSVEDGVVTVKPFDVNVKDIAMNISGQHGLNQDMAYKIQARIPRALLERSGVGQTAGSVIDRLTDQANKLGLNLKKSEFVNVGINLTGSITSPKVSLQLLGGSGDQTLAEAAEQTVKDEIEEQKQKLKDELQTRVEAGKEQAKSEVGSVVDSAKTAAEKQLESTKDRAVGAIKDKIANPKDTTKTDILGGILQDTSKADIKDRLDKFNPFKKKKKDEKKEGGG